MRNYNKEMINRLTFGIFGREKIKKYYYQFNIDDRWCTENCKVKSLVKIGGGYCVHHCEYNKGYSFRKNWIKCSKIKEATKKID